MTPAKSEGSPFRPTMVRAAIAAERAGSLATAALSRVGTNPGQTELQHTPERAHASDCERVSAARPPLDAPYPPLLPKARPACCEVTLTIRPHPRAAMDGPKRWPSRNGAVRFTAMVRSHSAGVSSASGGRRLTPAQLTRMSGSPKAAAADEAARSMAARSPRSALTPSAEHPCARSEPTESVSRRASRAISTTCAPARASADAIPWPIPELPPVTTATRPASENNSPR